MNVLKEMKKNTIISSVIYIIAGLVLAIFPDSTARTIGYAFATVILIAGLGFLYRFVTKDVKYSFIGNEMVIGSVLVVASIFVYIRVESVVSVIPVLLGIVITVSGISKLQNAIGLHNLHYKGATTVLALAVLNIVFGVVLILNPFGAVTTLIMLIGLGLIFSGVTDFVTTFLITRNLMKTVDKSEIIEVETRELE